MKIGFLIFTNLTPLDFVGPCQVLSQIPGAEIFVFAQSLDPIKTDAGFAVLPTHNLKNPPQMDVICVPGGPGQKAIMSDDEILNFLRIQGNNAKYVTSVCTGSLLLAKAGLLSGYKAGCHWVWRDQLKQFGATPVAERVVVDRNRLTGGGVTAGIDFGLTLAAELTSPRVAKIIQLALEYDPAPPFDVGSPEKAGLLRRQIVKQLFKKRYPIL
ncbi:MAG: DJ-1/PfpI family protein [Hellea sp.]